jgi:formylmethanofuran dehydrogenase subunit E
MSAIQKFTHPIHEYERSKYNKEVYRCVHPECTHFSRKGFLVGKRATCSKCKNPFILSLAQLRNKKPVCDYCCKSPKAAELREAKELVNQVMSGDDLPDEIKQMLIENTLE